MLGVSVFPDRQILLHRPARVGQRRRLRATFPARGLPPTVTQLSIDTLVLARPATDRRTLHWSHKRWRMRNDYKFPVWAAQALRGIESPSRPVDGAVSGNR
jgi:hypothetical protein